MNAVALKPRFKDSKVRWLICDQFGFGSMVQGDVIVIYLRIRGCRTEVRRNMSTGSQKRYVVVLDIAKSPKEGLGSSLYAWRSRILSI